MAHEIQRIRLRRLAAQIENARVALQFAPAGGAGPDADALDQVLAGCQHELAATRREFASRTSFNNTQFSAGHPTGQPQLPSQTQPLHEMIQLAKRVSDVLFGLVRQLGSGSEGESQALKGLESAFNHWLKSSKTEDDLFNQPVSAHVMTEIRRLQHLHPEPFGDGNAQRQPVGYFSLLHRLLARARQMNAACA